MSSIDPDRVCSFCSHPAINLHVVLETFPPAQDERGDWWYCYEPFTKIFCCAEHAETASDYIIEITRKDIG